MHRIALWFLLISPCLGQTLGPKNFLGASPSIDCKMRKPADKEILKTNKGFVSLAEATGFVIDAINEAKCENYDPVGRFQLMTADMDFQTLIDKDGTFEVLFIGGIAGELDKQVTSDSDFTYSVPTPFGAVPVEHSQMLLLLHNAKTKVTPAKTLGEAIAAAMKQMAAGVGDLPALSQHQVKVSIKFAFTKDGTLELEPTLGSVGIKLGFKKTETNTQTLTLTFADQAPTVNLSATPSSPISEGVSVTLIASVVPPVNSTAAPSGNVAFLDGNVSLSVKPLSSGFAGIIIPTLSPGVHSFTAVYGSDSRFDSTASTATVVVVTPNVLQR
jgi:prepilin-type processing-associated H-X9-DG protein